MITMPETKQNEFNKTINKNEHPVTKQNEFNKKLTRVNIKKNESLTCLTINLNTLKMVMIT